VGDARLWPWLAFNPLGDGEEPAGNAGADRPTRAMRLACLVRQPDVLGFTEAVIHQLVNQFVANSQMTEHDQPLLPGQIHAVDSAAPAQRRAVVQLSFGSGVS
jgi:hypothetical protein